MRKLVRQIHLWLGLVSGLLVFIIAVTGCLYAFQEEIQNATQPFRFVQVQDRPYMLPSKLQAIAQSQLPDKHLHSVKYNEPHKAAEAIFYDYEPAYYYTVFLNPYTGGVLKVNDNDKGFFRIVLNGHYYLWLPPHIGQPVVATATLVFVAMLITGIVLWFPRNWRLLKQSVGFVWNRNTQWKRKNYDLHNVLGYYASFFALILALTGLIWGFQWFAFGMYKGLGGKKSLVYAEPVSKTPTEKGITQQLSPIDSVWAIMQRDYPLAKSIEVHPPETDSSAISANANNVSGTYWQTDYRYFDQYTYEELTVGHIYGKLDDAKFADKVLRMNYDIHVGAIGGFAGKLLVFSIGLITASLPVTGVLIWWGRQKRKKQSE
ncbi:MAG: PepSY-associated TM helix domain-containing protein [Breznakibacter sp.]